MAGLLIALTLAFSAAASAEDIVILSTRGDVTQSYLLSSPPAGKERGIAVLFPGGAGKVDLERESARALLDGGNFLVRSRRLFAGSGIVAALMDAPSDQSRGMEDEFRLGAAHAEDVGRVVADLKRRFPGLPVYLVGTSSGTISAASAAGRLGPAVDGVALSATVLVANRRRTGLSGFDFSTIAVPLLFVHHVEDGCTSTPYSAVKRLADRYPVISVSGGPPPQSKPCETMSAHGFLGREADTVDAIAKWMLKQPYPREIN